MITSKQLWSGTDLQVAELHHQPAARHRSPRRIRDRGNFCMQICIGNDQPIAFNDDGVEAGLILGGRVATLRVVGTAGEDREPAALVLYRDWLPTSGEELHDVPLYCQRVKFCPLVPAHEAVTDLFLPLR
ncbi:GyrI-like domain-containing protein [Sphingomonas sp. 4RDLI-65]|uniref:GyrI-like domain-containing protein n=1 Tax=Sphingomonas sp. 4RDLI-65 TaxID=3111641 RepID=UPI003C1D1587